MVSFTSPTPLIFGRPTHNMTLPPYLQSRKNISSRLTQIFAAAGSTTIATMSTTPAVRRGGSFPYAQYKDLMPEDQYQKLLAMHENSTANAIMYVAIVLTVYIILLSLLLCRHMKRPCPREIPLPPLPRPSSNLPRAVRTSASAIIDAAEINGYHSAPIMPRKSVMDHVQSCCGLLPAGDCIFKHGAGGVSSPSSGDDHDDHHSGNGRRRRLSSPTPVSMTFLQSVGPQSPIMEPSTAPRPLPPPLPSILINSPRRKSRERDGNNEIEVVETHNTPAPIRKKSQTVVILD